jgi:hypothetical protein
MQVKKLLPEGEQIAREEPLSSQLQATRRVADEQAS